METDRRCDGRLDRPDLRRRADVICVFSPRNRNAAVVRSLFFVRCASRVGIRPVLQVALALALALPQIL